MQAGEQKRWTWRWLFQVVASLVILVLLFRSIDRAALDQVLEGAVPAWLGLALVVKSISLLLHEIRLWVALSALRPALGRVVTIGFAAGLLNLVLPARAGDLAAIGMLRKKAGVPLGRATAAVGVVGFLEAAVFGVFLLLVLLFGAASWAELLGVATHRQAMWGVAIVTLSGMAVAVVGVAGGQKIEDLLRSLSQSWLRDLLIDIVEGARHSLGASTGAALNVGLAVIQVTGLVVAFSLAFPAVGLEIERPWMAAAGVVGIASLASVVLPPSYGAGPAAASVAVLSIFGIDSTGALAYAAAYWVLSQLPAVFFGLPAFLWIGRVPDLADPPPAEPDDLPVEPPTG